MNDKEVGKITSYSCENFKLSFAFNLSMWSASSKIGIGGWLAIPVEQEITKFNVNYSDDIALKFRKCSS